MTIKLHRPLLLLLALALSGCSREEVFLPRANEEGEIVFDAKYPSATRSEVVTRGEAVTELHKIGVFGYSHTGDFADEAETLSPDFFLNQAVVDLPGNGTWTYDGARKYWPTDGRSVSFFAYAPFVDVEDTFTLNTSSGAPTIAYTVPAAIDDQIDLMWDHQLDMTAETEAGVVPLAMNHALTKVNFAVKLALEAGVTSSNLRVRFEELEVRNVAGSGVLDLNTGLWSVSSSETTYTMIRNYYGDLTDAVLDATKTSTTPPEISPYDWNDLFLSGQYLMLIPQALTPPGNASGLPPAMAVLSYTLIDPVAGTETKQTETLALSTSTPSATWTPGQGITYRITLLGNSGGGGGLGDPEPVEYVNFYSVSGGTTANSFILNPAPAGGAARLYTIPISQVNRYWNGVNGENPGYGSYMKSHEDEYMIGTDDGWEVSLIWTDMTTNASDLTNIFSASSVDDPITLVDNNGVGAGMGTGPSESFQLSVPAGLPAGNFVLGIKKAGVPEYLWSWHFWVTDYNPDSFNKANIAAGTYTYTVPGGQVERYADNADNEVTLWEGEGAYADNVMMDRNLGAVETFFTTQITWTGMRGVLHYQYGRKDPFPSQAIGTVPTLVSAASISSASIVASVQNPTTFYYNGNANWVTSGEATGQGFAWNDPLATGGAKSVYDPCPPGWQLPKRDTWRDFKEGRTVLNDTRGLSWSSGQGIASVQGLRYWPGGASDPVGGRIWYPVTGIRTGDGMGATSNGYYWADTVFEREDLLLGNTLGFYTGRLWSPFDGDFRANGASVRCVSSD